MDHPADNERTAVMKSLLDSDLHDELVKFRQGAIDIDIFQQWVENNRDRLAQNISAGNLLKLRRGDSQKVMASIALVLPTCVRCGNICYVGPFTTRSEHATCALSVEMALKNGQISGIPRPGWAPIDSVQLGADAYFKCMGCGSLWTLVEPERQDNGTWERLA